MINDLRDVELPKEKLNNIMRAVVEDNVDPLKAGRCKVRIVGIHGANKTRGATDGIPTADLPWAEPVLGLIEGSISGYGCFGVPLQGSHVFVFFESGNIMQPRYFGSAPAIPTVAPDSSLGFNDPAGVYPNRIGQPDWQESDGPGSLYPHVVMLRVHGGHYIEIDSTPNEERMKVYHKTGTYIEINRHGDVTTDGVRNVVTNANGNIELRADGNIIIMATGSVDINGSTVDIN